MARGKIGWYYEVYDFDDTNPHEVLKAHQMITDIQETVARKARQTKRDELSGFTGNLALAEGQVLDVLRLGRKETKIRIQKLKAEATVEHVMEAKGDLVQAASTLGVTSECVRQRLVRYVERKWVERVGIKEWRVLPECMNGEGE